MKLGVEDQWTFNPLPSHEGRRDNQITQWRSDFFQSTSLSRGKTVPGQFPDARRIFQSTSLSRGKTPIPAIRFKIAIFQSTSLSRGKTLSVKPGKRSMQLSIHFPLTREDWASVYVCLYQVLSIHFPLTREDCSFVFSFTVVSLSIHFPLTREDSQTP